MFITILVSMCQSMVWSTIFFSVTNAFYRSGSFANQSKINKPVHGSVAWRALRYIDWSVIETYGKGSIKRVFAASTSIIDSLQRIQLGKHRQSIILAAPLPWLPLSIAEACLSNSAESQNFYIEFNGYELIFSEIWQLCAEETSGFRSGVDTVAMD